MSNVLISVVTPCFNSEKTIEKTLQSVLNQTYQNYEYIIIDGKSTDNTINIIEQYKEKFGDKLKVVSEKDDGIYDAMNKGINLAKGELVGIVNSDDFYEPDALENISNEYKNEKYAVIYGMMRILSEGKEKSVLINNHEFLKEGMITHPTCFVTKALYTYLGGYSLEYKVAADYEFMLRASQKADAVFKPVYKIISNFATGGLSTTTHTSRRERVELWYKYGTISKKKYLIENAYVFILETLKKIGV